MQKLARSSEGRRGKGQSGRYCRGKGEGIERLSCGCRSLLAAVREGGVRGRAEGTVGGLRAGGLQEFSS